MRTYTAKFYGRTKGAIGIFHWITDTIQGLDERDATIRLYDRYEDVHRLTLEEI